MKYVFALSLLFTTQLAFASFNVCGQVRSDERGQKYLVVPTSPASWASYLLMDEVGGTFVSSLTEMEFVCLEGEIDTPANSGLGVFTVKTNP